MADTARESGVVGLGRMGANLSLQALQKGMRVGGFDIKVVPDELLKAGLVEIGGLEEFREKLSPPRPIFIYVAAGPIVDRVIDNLTAYLERGDIIVDAGNSYCADPIRRHERMAEGKSHFTDPGTSGGMEGTRHGACPRAGGERSQLLGPNHYRSSQPRRAAACMPARQGVCPLHQVCAHGMGSWI